MRYLLILFQGRKFIFWNVFIITLFSLILAFILPKRYKATGQILPPPDEPTIYSLSTILPSSSPTQRLMLRSWNISDALIAILRSRTIKEYVINNTKFLNFYKFKKIEDALNFLNTITKISQTEEMVIKISVEAKDRNLACEMVNAYIAALDNFLKESMMSRGKYLRIFLENQLKKVEKELAEARDSLKNFQERYKLPELEEGLKSVLDAYAQLKSQLIIKETELEIAKDFSSPENPYYQDLIAEVKKFREKLGEIEKGGGLGGFGPGFGTPFKKLPAVASEYIKRYQEWKLKSEIYVLLQQQYQQAKLTEAKDTPTITILDYAKVPERPSFPKKKIIVLGGFFFSLIFSILVLFTKEYINSHKELKDFLSEALTTLKKEIFLKRKSENR
ncbi:MAG: Wzz/FepE/Etk N-terminal domain-containing protein [candidate division WOR-3 bacterium]|nr:Wzz/FepE/Etk N-terminal domain-containing protein [candidate division WOR-3 bacterium]MCX7836692.1 Wzz/FepE/Etk N-terminal domain-containing protein [candidate division WOR-3 bacterium]MDW8113471.1 GNVR domain-containing protein [candidate division WOR-3 bacterium]